MKTKRKFRPKISLAGLLLLCPFAALSSLWIQKQNTVANAQSVAAKWIGEQQHGMIRYDSQTQDGGFVDPRSDDPGLLGRLIGAEYVPLYGLTELRWLSIVDTAIPPDELDAFRKARPDVQLEVSL